MSEQMTPELEARLGAWLALRAPAEVPAELVERVAAIPRRSATVPMARPSILPRAGRRLRPMLAAAATLVVLAALLTGALFVAANRHDAIVPVTSASPTVEPSPSELVTPAPTATPGESAVSRRVLPAVIPDGVENGGFETPLGHVRWVHLQGDDETLPGPNGPIQMPDGNLAWFTRGGPGAACANEPTSTACTDPPAPALTVSRDALAPRVARGLPVASAEADLRFIGDTFWLVTSDPLSIWRSDDLADWQQTDPSGLRSPGPATLDWKVAVSPTARVGDATIASVRYTAADPGSLLGYAGRDVRLAKTESGAFEVRLNRSMRNGGDLRLGDITIEKALGGLRFVDATGQEVGHVDGVGLDFAESWVRRGEIAYDRLAVSDGTRWSPVDLPIAQPADWPLIVPLDGAAMAFALEPNQTVRGWRTIDGRTWTGGQMLDDGILPLRASGVTYQEGSDGPVIIVYGTDGTNGWRSTDGRTWQPAPIDTSAMATVRLPQGWLRTGDQTEDGSWQVSRDGTTWEVVPALADVVTKTAPLGAGGTNEFAVGITAFFVVEEGDASTRDVWMLEFENAGR